MNDNLIKNFNKFRKLVNELYEKYDGFPVCQGKEFCPCKDNERLICRFDYE